jgi:GNAT superfamily N-acetyltransferase
MTLDDVPEGLRLSRAAGWNQREEDWRLLLGLNPGRFVVAVAHGRVIGTGGAACYGTALAWVCMILVDPDERGRGIGTLVTEKVLEGVRDVARIGLDATPQGEGVYARLGFAESGRLFRVAVDRPRRGDPRAVETQALSRNELDPVLELDREVFGADRGDLLRWALEQAPESARVAKNRGAVEGYCFGRRGDHSHQIAPVVARRVAVARALVADALEAPRAGRVIVDAAADHADWLESLRGLGFREHRPLMRMYRGGALPPGRPELQLAIFGPEFG